MGTRQVVVERLSLVSKRAFADVVASIDAVVGHPDLQEFNRNRGAAQSPEEVESAVQGAIGSSGFMEFMRLDLGPFLEKERGPSPPKLLRLIIGNPLIMKQMARHVPDAGSYAPVTILVDRRDDGVHLSYDTMQSYLAPYDNAVALRVARDLDLKVEALLKHAAGE